MKRTETRRPAQGLFLTLEGPEGSGKSTHIRHLATLLKRSGYHDVVQTREPGGTTIAEAIRGTLLMSYRGEPMIPVTEALLILAARSQHVTHVIEPALQRGAVVLCDRFSDSTIAYQGFGRGLDLRWLQEANRVVTNGRDPDLTLLLDVPVGLGLRRRRNARGHTNRLDRESARFHQRVRKGFLRLARVDSRRIKIIRADKSEKHVRAEIQAVVLGWLRKRRHRSAN